MADVANITGQKRLHDQSLNRADEQDGSRLRVKVGVQFSVRSFLLRSADAVVLYNRLYKCLHYDS